MNDCLELIDQTLSRLKGYSYRTYDHYDFWGSRFGTALRKYKNGPLKPFVGAAYLAEIVFPRLFRIGSNPEVAMETLPHLLRAMNRYRRITGSNEYEDDRRKLYQHAIGKLGRTSHGRGMGHQFDWFTGTLIPAYTPCVTFTSYLVDYILDESGESGAEENLAVLKDIGEFVFHDLNMEDVGSDAIKVSYTPLDTRWVINANSYASRIMNRLGMFLGNGDYLKLSRKLLNYVINCQNDDGGWYYFEPGSVPGGENFIDCFHTAFVLENLLEPAREDGRVRESLSRGMRYFLETFIHEDGTVRHFARSHLPVRIIADTRSSAEAVNLLAMASSTDPAYLETAFRICRKTTAMMYDSNNRYYYHRRYSFHLSRMDYARWGTIPMINAMISLLIATERSGINAKCAE